MSFRKSMPVKKAEEPPKPVETPTREYSRVSDTSKLRSEKLSTRSRDDSSRSTIREDSKDLVKRSERAREHKDLPTREHKPKLREKSKEVKEDTANYQWKTKGGGGGFVVRSAVNNTNMDTF